MTLQKMLTLLGRDVMDVLIKRYAFLRAIRFYAPVGRRQLSLTVGCTEREARNETEYLRTMGLIDTGPAGMSLTLRGGQLLEEMQAFISSVSANDSMEEDVAARYGFKSVTVVLGNASRHQLIMRDLGQAAAIMLRELLPAANIVGITGHRACKYICDAQFPAGMGAHAKILPLRDAHFTEEDEQANNNCARLARKCGADYSLLHLAHDLSMNELEKRFKEPDVKAIQESLKQADVLVTGLNTLGKSEIFKTLSVRAQENIVQSQPACELLGTFFRQDGRQINNTPLYSVPFEWFARAKEVIIIAVGAELVPALKIFSRRIPALRLFTDEATAKELLKD